MTPFRRHRPSTTGSLPVSAGVLDARKFGRALALYGLTGVVVGLVAVAFVWLVSFLDALLVRPFIDSADAAISFPNSGRWWILVLPTVGGAVSGLLCSRWAPEAMGAGVGNVIDAYHRRQGLIRYHVPWVKSVASAVTLGFGGSAGVEGPIGQVGAGLGSILGRTFKLKAGERKIVVMAGFAAGIGAVFHAPMAAAIFAAEVLYREVDLEHEVLVPSIITATISYAVFGAVLGWDPVVVLPQMGFENVFQLVPYTVLGIFLALAGAGFVRAYKVLQSRLGFAQSLPLWVRPALGGFLVGLVGLFVPMAIGGGYALVQVAIDGNLAVWLLLLLGVAKMLTSAFTAGLGMSGGLFGPSLVIGGLFGAAVGHTAVLLGPQLQIDPAAFVIVGMAGFFAAVSNAPLSTVIMVAEVVGSYELIVPALWVCTLAFLFNRRSSLYDDQVPTRLDAPSQMHDMMGAVLHRIPVAEAVGTRKAVTVHPEDTLTRLVRIFAESAQVVFPIVDDQDRLMGVVDGKLLRRTMAETGFERLMIADDFLTKAVTVCLGDTLYDAIGKMTAKGIEAVVVVDQDDPQRLLGLLSRREIVSAYHRKMLETANPSLEPAGASDSYITSDELDLAGTILRGGLMRNIEAKTREQALRVIVDRAKLPESLDREALFRRLCEREQMSSTGIGDGVAFPHPHADDFELEESRAVLAFLKRPVDWGAFDNEPVQTVCVLLACSGSEHLTLLARLASCISDPILRQLLRRRSPRRRILDRIRAIQREAQKGATDAKD